MERRLPLWCPPRTMGSNQPLAFLFVVAVGAGGCAHRESGPTAAAPAEAPGPATAGGGGGLFPVALTLPAEASLAAVERWRWPAHGAFEEEFRGASSARLAGEARTDWAYATTLIGTVPALKEPQTWDELKAAPEFQWSAEQWSSQVAAVTQASTPSHVRLMELLAIASHTPNAEAAIDAIVGYAEGATDDTLLARAYAATIPVGGCSMDSRPAKVAKDLAERCFAKKRLGCFLQLQLRVMGDQFQRVAYSSYGEAAHGTDVNRLGTLGISVERFLLGLAIQLPEGNRAAELQPYRLARAILEADLAAGLGPKLVARVEDERLPGPARLRATQVWASLQLRDQGASLADVDAKLKQLKLSPEASAWWQKQLADERQ